MGTISLTKPAMMASLASTWGDPMQMVDDAFGVHHGPSRTLIQAKRKQKADKARKNAKKARKRNRRK